MEMRIDQVFVAHGQENRFPDDEDEDFRDAWEEFVSEGIGNFKSLISRVDKDVLIEGLLRKKLLHFKEKYGCQTVEKILSKITNREVNNTTIIKERGLDDDISNMELKLDRFKVRAVNVIGSGVVKEEGQ